jgi:DNA-binding NarL/FixJ family response regulator
MTRVIVVADSGAVLASLTTAVGTVPGAYVVRHSSSANRLDLLVGHLSPDLVVIGDLRVPEDALARLAEIASAAPDAKTVVLSSSPEAGWLADALRARAAAVLPGNVEPLTLGLVLREVLDTQATVHELPQPAAKPSIAGVAA